MLSRKKWTVADCTPHAARWKYGDPQ